MISSGVAKGLNNKGKVTQEIVWLSYLPGARTLLHITRLASCLSRNAPTISSDEPNFQILSLSAPPCSTKGSFVERRRQAHKQKSACRNALASFAKFFSPGKDCLR